MNIPVASTLFQYYKWPLPAHTEKEKEKENPISHTHNFFCPSLQLPAVIVHYKMNLKFSCNFKLIISNTPSIKFTYIFLLPRFSSFHSSFLGFLEQKILFPNWIHVLKSYPFFFLPNFSFWKILNFHWSWQNDAKTFTFA